SAFSHGAHPAIIFRWQGADVNTKPIRTLSAALLLLTPTLRGEGYRFEIHPDPWHLAGFENSLDLSAIASAAPGRVLVGSDEMFHVQPGVMDAATHRIESRRPIALPVQAPGDKAEVDIEGIAWVPETSAYYVTGSHGVGKKKGDVQPDRLAIFRVPVNPEDGEIRGSGIERASLETWIRGTKVLEPYLHVPLQKNGLNIEGLTSRDGRLFFGLRAPNIEGDGIVLEIPSEAPFGSEKGSMTVHRVPVGEGRGIREIVAVRGGFILLTGNASAEPSKKIPDTEAAEPDTRFELLFWNGSGRKVSSIGTLPENGGKAEGMLVLEDANDQIQLLVVFDSLLAGEPMAITVHRPEGS
nr:DUF3616 domain-containing protein [Akkermansiaceae bacterium]